MLVFFAGENTQIKYIVFIGGVVDGGPCTITVTVKTSFAERWKPGDRMVDKILVNTSPSLRPLPSFLK
ncbi:MAG: hypothetical protein IPO25_02335 [Saprospiraceae bacterium]|nr:hypothetical protein [Saprospiraceae bacterium]